MAQDTAQIRKVQDKEGAQFFPITHVDAVIDQNGDAVSTLLAGKQATLVSGTNIKTINSQSLLGSGNIVIEGGGGGGSIDTIVMNGDAVTVTGGVADLGTVITQHQDISGKADKVSNSTNGNFAGLDANGNLTDSGYKHSDYQAALVSGTNIKTVNNTSLLGSGNVSVGTYSKPSTGIPKTDLASAVQTSLGKADTALQSYTETDPVFSASTAASISSSDISNWNGKQDTISDLNDIRAGAALGETALQSYTETDPTVPSWAKASSKPTYTASEVGAIATSAKGAANGVAELDSGGKVPVSQLPSYVDDVLEYSAKSSFPSTGETGKIYVDVSTNLTYRWGGSAYIEISPSLALGTTSSTAFRGDYGNTAYAHATNKGAAFSSGLYKITTNSEGHVTAATAAEKADITALGIPSENTTYSLVTASVNGLAPMFSTGNKTNSVSTNSYHFLGITDGTLKWYSLPANAFNNTTYSQGTGINISGTTISLASGVCTTGTYKSVTVDTYGRVTSGTNPTTLSEYGITDALRIKGLDSTDVLLSDKVWTAGTTNKGEYSTQTECPTLYGAFISLQYDVSKNQGFQIYGDTTPGTGGNTGIYYRVRLAGDTQTTYEAWRRVLDEANFSTIIGSTTYAPYNAAGYLPLSGGSSYPMTGELYIQTGTGISDATGNGLLVYHPTAWTGASNTQWAVGATDSQGVIRSSDTNLIHYKGGTNHTIWDAGNSNLSTVDWTANNLYSTRASVGTTNNNSKLTIDSGYAAPATASVGTSAGLEVGNRWDRSMYFGMAASYGWIQACYYGDGTYTSGSNTSAIVLNPLGGNVGIGMTSPSYKLHVSGDIVATGVITPGGASDARLKTNISTLSNSDAKSLIMALRPVTFTWNDKAKELYDQYRGDDLGFVAQEVENVLPTAVGSIFEKYKRLDQTKFIAPLVAVTKDHEARIQQIEEKLNIINN